MDPEDYEPSTSGQDDWSSHLPSFANKANRELDAYIKRVRQELEYTDVSLEDNEDRIKVMSEHLANVQAELKYTQSRCNAKTNEIQTEDHLKQLSKRQGVRFATPSSLGKDAFCSVCWSSTCPDIEINDSTHQTACTSLCRDV